MEAIQTHWFWAFVGFSLMAVGAALMYALPVSIREKYKRFYDFLTFMIIGGAIILILVCGSYFGGDYNTD